MSHKETAPFPYTRTGELLEAHAHRLRSASIQHLLRSDDTRCRQFSVAAAGLHLDYSRHLLDTPARDELWQLARDAGLDSARAPLFEGSPINHTEGRAVLHTLLRSSSAPAGLEKEFSALQECRQRMDDWVDCVHRGEHRGYDDRPITDVVNLGIGGSDLGPRMACQALTPSHRGPKVHFVANIDPAELSQTLKPLDPATTLFIICSKTLRTEETLNNAQAARRWLLQHSSEAAVEKHFLAVSTNLEAARSFGIPADNILPLWDWVGGRYSLWSAIGWSIAFAIGKEGFADLLAGAEAMDRHFRTAPLAQNMPVMLSLLEVWYVNFMGARNQAVIPYHHHLRRLPAFLQQLSMESNGKRVNRQGKPLEYATAPVLWGDEGSNGQHSFHQLLHQGTLLCPVDFVLPLSTDEAEADMHRRLVANCLSQAQALLLGRDEAASRASLLKRGHSEEEADNLAPHLVIPGNRPSSTISCDALDPHTLGALLALYEHKTFCSGWVWQINSFDQFGVELGKELSGDIYAAMRDDAVEVADASTAAMLERWRSSR